MKKIFFKQLLKNIRTDSISILDLEDIVNNYMSLNLNKSQVRKLISTYEKNILKNIGILDRDTTDEFKEKIKKDLELSQLIVNNTEINKKGQNNTNSKNDIDQQLKVGDIIYTFKLRDKLKDITI